MVYGEQGLMTVYGGQGLTMLYGRYGQSAAPQLANTQASCSKQAAQAKPKGLLRVLCAGDAENANQQGFSLSRILGNDAIFSW